MSDAKPKLTPAPAAKPKTPAKPRLTSHGGAHTQGVVDGIAGLLPAIIGAIGGITAPTGPRGGDYGWIGDMPKGGSGRPGGRPKRPPVALPVEPRGRPRDTPVYVPPSNGGSDPPGTRPGAPARQQRQLVDNAKRNVGVSPALEDLRQASRLQGIVTALADRFPRLICPVRGKSYLSDEGAGQVPKKSRPRHGNPPFAQSGGAAGAAADGFYYGCNFYTSCMKNHINVANQYAVGNASFGSWTSSDDAILADVTSEMAAYGWTRTCVRVMNGGSLTAAGGTLLYGRAPTSIFVSGLTFATLQSYAGTAESDMHSDMDKCTPHRSDWPSDYTYTKDSTSTASGKDEVIFVAWKAATAQIIDVEVVNGWDIRFLPGSLLFETVENIPINQEALQEAEALCWASTGSMPPVCDTAAEPASLFSIAGTLLGKGAKRIIAPFLESTMDFMTETASSLLMESRALERTLRTATIGAFKHEDIEKCLAKGAIPLEVATVLHALSDVKVRFTKTGVIFKLRNGDLHTYDWHESTSDGFDTTPGCYKPVVVQCSHPTVDEPDEKYSIVSKRSGSTTRR